MTWEMSVSTVLDFSADINELYDYYLNVYLSDSDIGEYRKQNYPFIDKHGEVERDVLYCYSYYVSSDDEYNLMNMDTDIFEYEYDDDDENVIKKMTRKNKLVKLKEVSELC